MRVFTSGQAAHSCTYVLGADELWTVWSFSPGSDQGKKHGIEPLDPERGADFPEKKATLIVEDFRKLYPL